MTQRGWRAVGWAVGAVSVSGALAAVAVLLVNGLPWIPGGSLDLVYFLTSALLYGPVVALMLPRRRHPVAVVVTITALGSSAGALLTSLTMLGPDGPLAGHGLLAHLPVWIWVPGTFATIAVLPWLVTDRGVGRVANGMVVLGLVALATTVLQLATQQLPWLPANPLHVDIDLWRRTVAWLDYWPGRLCLAVGVAAAGHLVLRWWRGPEDLRPGLGWLAIGQALLTVSFLQVVFPRVLGGGDLASALAFGLIGAQAFLPAALLVVVLRQRLWGIDVAVSRALVGGLLSAAVVALYLALVWLSRQVLPWPEEISSVLAVGLLAVAMLPLRSLIQRRVSNLVYGVSRNPGVLLRDLGEHLSGPEVRASDLDGLMRKLRGGLRLGQVELRAADGVVLASSGEAANDALGLQVIADGRPIGELRLAPRAGERLDRRTVRTVEQLGGLVAVAVQLAEANRDLGTARDRLLQVRHEERRMLRRELHDELGPALAGIGLGLAAVRNTVTVDEPTDVLLDQLQDELAQRTDDVRLMAGRCSHRRSTRAGSRTRCACWPAGSVTPACA